ncbi:hypothetical protein IV203_001768 [Nitzschia inconspicua]|uniref:Uncharacterized protein n=1 Tax=Nitzschia inconspicua TaxID=303405 RepID=A0A9K3L7C1_9STRA|nr:hypothetical protein IV203_001768 [Nitzschia inconspicua]
MGPKVPALVVHTTAPKQAEEKPGLLDGMWACLLNDYLDNIGDGEEFDSDSSTSDAVSVSTDLLREERRRLRKLKKKERMKFRLKGRTIEKLRESAMAMAEERSKAEAFSGQSLFENLESTSNGKSPLDVVASKKMEARKKQMDTLMKKTKSSDRYEPVHNVDREPHHAHRVSTLDEEKAKVTGKPTLEEKVKPSSRPTFKRKPRTATRPSLEPEAVIPPMVVQNWSEKNIEAGMSTSKSQSSSVDADGLIARSEWMRLKGSLTNSKSSIDPAGISGSSTHVDAHGVIHIEDHVAEKIRSADERQTWHTRRDLPSHKPNPNKTYYPLRKSVAEIDRDDRAQLLHQRSLHQNEKQVNLALPTPTFGHMEVTSRSGLLAATANFGKHSTDDSFKTIHAFPKNISIPKDAVSSNEQVVGRIDSRDTEENIWSLEEDKRSELDEIRRKKLDREEALIRIRAIKARIAKLES